MFCQLQLVRKSKSGGRCGRGKSDNKATTDDGAFNQSEAQPPAPALAPNMTIEQSNRNLFRDDAAFRRFMAHFEVRQLSDCFYFDPEGRIPTLYMDHITQWIDHWQLAHLINCQDIYSILSTRLFYANLQFTDSPYGATSYMFGTVLNLSVENLADIFQVPNAGEEVYINRSWPSLPNVTLESREKYRWWFDHTWKPGMRQYTSSLPALHRLLYLFVNNILTPKISVKTKLERMTMFLLRHLISRDDLSINVPFFILKHIENACKGNQESLPYSNVIHRILRAHNIDPLQAIPAENTLSPVNLLTYLNSIGWVQLKNGNLKPDPNNPINDWILAPNALPNQYWDPAEEPILVLILTSCNSYNYNSKESTKKLIQVLRLYGPNLRV